MQKSLPLFLCDIWARKRKSDDTGTSRERQEEEQEPKGQRRGRCPAAVPLVTLRGPLTSPATPKNAVNKYLR